MTTRENVKDHILNKKCQTIQTAKKLAQTKKEQSELIDDMRCTEEPYIMIDRKVYNRKMFSSVISIFKTSDIFFSS